MIILGDGDGAVVFLCGSILPISIHMFSRSSWQTEQLQPFFSNWANLGVRPGRESTFVCGGALRLPRCGTAVAVAVVCTEDAVAVHRLLSASILAPWQVLFVCLVRRTFDGGEPSISSTARSSRNEGEWKCNVEPCRSHSFLLASFFGADLRSTLCAERSIRELYTVFIYL